MTLAESLPVRLNTLAQEQKYADFSDYLRRTFNPQSILTQARDEWKEAFDPDKVTQYMNHLLELVSSPDADRNTHQRETRKKLKIIRKHGTHLINAWRFCDESHTYPSHLERVVTGIGDVIDAHKRPTLLFHTTNRLRDRLSTYSQLGLPHFTPSTFESFLGFYTGLLRDVQTHLVLPDPTIEDHHRLRRRARSFRHYFALLERIAVDPISTYITNHLFAAVAEMGNEQNAFRTQEFDGLADPDSTSAPISPEHRELLTRFLEMHPHELLAMQE